MRNIKCIMSFSGAAYHGFQSQPDGKTVQQTVERAASELTREDVKIIGCGRTDAGVHGIGYCFNFKTNSSIPAEKFPLAFNSVLPDDISVKSCEEVGEDFHAGFSALRKTYRYKIYNSRIRDPFYNSFSWFFPAELDMEKMKKGAEFIVGEHDFKAFMAQGGSVKTTVRTVYSIEISKSGDLINIDVTGNGFLYNMVRIIAGTLVAVGVGKIAPEEIESIILGGDRERAGATAPPQGLYLKEVFYNE